MTTMQAGRELDALIAERVMGWTRPTREFQPWDCQPSTPGCVLRTAHGLPHFSTDIAAAWRVVEAMQNGDETAWDAFIERLTSGPMPLGWLPSDDTALAICLAAIATPGSLEGT